jgi:hypothetical protein
MVPGRGQGCEAVHTSTKFLLRADHSAKADCEGTWVLARKSRDLRGRHSRSRPVAPQVVGDYHRSYGGSSPGRSVAQPGSASAWGAEGREFESLRSDHLLNGLWKHGNCRLVLSNQIATPCGRRAPFEGLSEISWGGLRIIGGKGPNDAAMQRSLHTRRRRGKGGSAKLEYILSGTGLARERKDAYIARRRDAGPEILHVSLGALSGAVSS